MGYRNQNKSAKKISDEKDRIQTATHEGTAITDICGHCGRKVIMVPGENYRWYHYTYETLIYISKAELVRYCVTTINRNYQSITKKKEERKKLPPKARATPKTVVDEAYRELSGVAKERLRIIQDELTRL